MYIYIAIYICMTELRTYPRVYTYTHIDIYTYICTYVYIHVHMTLAHLFPCPKATLFAHSQTQSPRASHSRRVCCVAQHTCPKWATADMSAWSHSRSVFRVKQQTRVMRDAADMSAVRHSSHCYCVTQQSICCVTK